MDALKKQLSQRLNDEVESIVHYTQGQIGDIYTVQTRDSTYMLKTSKPSSLLYVESKMLEDINKYYIRVPKVYSVGETHLLMEYVETTEVENEFKEIHAAKILSQLHSVTNDARMYGYYYDTSIGPFSQRNEQTQYHWALFLGHMRILPMAKICYDKGRITLGQVERLELLCKELYMRIDMSCITPSLLHGDLWAGNMLFHAEGATLIDPAISFGDKEMDLAYILMFGTFGDTFFKAYTKVHTLSEDFYDVKVPLYQVYPLLVHVALYGGSYVSELEVLLKRLKV